ncbi:hypothetical protein L2E82_16022 [Cichorium intybus]|uniref:Uncharacterized protein n=1 Tax=Cichorium intybus TaxID=13427 RepID=A0ACB9F4E2_CICIN|nr:hypothetical protein L2E82_16022 [Cichorium intybus]
MKRLAPPAVWIFFRTKWWLAGRNRSCRIHIRKGFYLYDLGGGMESYGVVIAVNDLFSFSYVGVREGLEKPSHTEAFTCYINHEHGRVNFRVTSRGLELNVRGESILVDLVVRVLEFMKQIEIVSVTSVDAGTRMLETQALTNRVILRLRIQDVHGLALPIGSNLGPIFICLDVGGRNQIVAQVDRGFHTKKCKLRCFK